MEKVGQMANSQRIGQDQWYVLFTFFCLLFPKRAPEFSSKANAYYLLEPNFFSNNKGAIQDVSANQLSQLPQNTTIYWRLRITPNEKKHTFN